jgi:single-stranded DNA-binding protein
MNYQRLILVGNATGDAQRRTSKKGDMAYTTFNVGVGGGKDRTTFFPVVVFGKHGEAVDKYITKGRQVLVEGRIEVSNSGRFNVVADQVRLGASAGEGKPAAAKPTKKSKGTK